jgi:DNA-binding MarR family transcriptional regulator
MDTPVDPVIKASNLLSDAVIIELRKIIQVIEQNSKRLVRRVGLTGPQLVILKEIANHQQVSVGDIARRASLSQGTVTGILERLEKRDLVRRQRSRDDRRRVLVRITDAGDRLLAKAPPLFQEDFVEQFNQRPVWLQTMILSSLQHLVTIMNTRVAEGRRRLKAEQDADGRTTTDEKAQSLI